MTILVLGSNGLAGSAICRNLELNNRKFTAATRSDVDLLNFEAVDKYFNKIKPSTIIGAAALVGGMAANIKYPVEFLINNITIQNNTILSAHNNNVSKYVFLGSSCVYPREAESPISENQLLTGPLEKTNEPYAIAKISGIKMCESYNFQYKTNYKCLMPANTYGPNDNYDFESSHFFPAIINKVYLAKNSNKKFITLWGSGKAERELIYVDDLADACIYFMDKKLKEALINIGTGDVMSIFEYAKFVIKELNANLKIKFDRSKPDGTPIKVLDISRAKKYGWYPKTNLKTGFKLTYKSFLQAFANNSTAK